MSAVPVSVLAVVEHAFPARSVAVDDGVQLIFPVAAAVVTEPVAVPSVIVIVEPLMTIVDAWPLAPKVRFDDV